MFHFTGSLRRSGVGGDPPRRGPVSAPSPEGTENTGGGSHKTLGRAPPHPPPQVQGVEHSVSPHRLTSVPRHSRPRNNQPPPQPRALPSAPPPSPFCAAAGPGRSAAVASSNEKAAGSGPERGILPEGRQEEEEGGGGARRAAAGAKRLRPSPPTSYRSAAPALATPPPTLARFQRGGGSGTAERTGRGAARPSRPPCCREDRLPKNCCFYITKNLAPDPSKGKGPRDIGL